MPLGILAVGFLVTLLQPTASSVAHAFGRMKLVTFVMFGVSAANVLLSIYFVMVLGWGLAGVACGTAAVQIAYRVPFWSWFLSRKLKVPWRRYVWHSVVIPLVHVMPISVVLLLLYVSGIGHGWPGLLTVVGATVLCHAVYMVLWGLPKQERELIRRVLGRIVGIS